MRQACQGDAADMQQHKHQRQVGDKLVNLLQGALALAVPSVLASVPLVLVAVGPGRRHQRESGPAGGAAEPGRQRPGIFFSASVTMPVPAVAAIDSSTATAIAAPAGLWPI